MRKLSNLEKIKKYLKIEKNHIYAKTTIIISIDKEEIKFEEEELINTSESSEDESLHGSINIPGILNIEIPEENDIIQLYFPFDINLMVPDEQEKIKEIVKYTYHEGDLITFAKTKSNATDIMILDKLFENRIKYLRGDLEKHTVAIYDQLINTKNIQFHHIEVILSILYGEYTENGFEPVRLTKNQQYTKKNAISTKDSSHRFNNAVGFNYGYTKDVIAQNIARKYEPSKTDFEKIISGEFSELGK